MSTVPIHSGMLLEILNEKNELLFEAKISRIVRDDLVELTRLSEGEVPLGAAPAKVHIRGYNVQQNRGIWLEGKITRFAPQHDNLWLLEEMKVTGQDSGRTYSRQYNTRAKGTVRSALDTEAAPVPCSISNISSGGAAIRTEAVFRKDEELILWVRGRKGKELHPLRCAIRRLTELEDGAMQYGCEFLTPDAQAEDDVIKMVLEVEMMSLPNEIELSPPRW